MKNATRVNRGTPGRPSNRGMVADRLRVAVERALDVLDGEERPIHILIAENLKADLPRTLTALRGFFPQEATLKVESAAQAHLAELRALMEARQAVAIEQQGPMLDVTPVRVEEPEKSGNGK